MALALAAIVAPPSSADDPEPTCNPPELGEEWFIWDVVMCSNRELHVRHIEVRESGSLTLDNVTLILHPQEGSHPAGAQHGRFMGQDGLYSFTQTTAPVGARVTIRDSEIRSFTAELLPRMSLGGTVIIERSEIPETAGKLGFDSGTSGTVRHNHFMGTELNEASGDGMVIEDNLFEGGANTNNHVSIWTHEPTVIRNNTFVNCNTAILTSGGASVIENNTITNCRISLVTDSEPSSIGSHNNDIFNNWDRSRPWLGGDSGGWDARSNFWGCRGPLGSRNPALLYEEYSWVPHDPILWEPVHPERLPQPATSPIATEVEVGVALQLDESGSLPSQHFGFPLESYEWRIGPSDERTWLRYYSESTPYWFRLNDNVTIIEGKQATHVFDETGSYDITFIVYDEKGLNHCLVHTVEAVRSPPTVAVSLDPAEPFAGDALAAVVEAEDALGGEVSVSYEWKRNGVAQAIDGTTVPSNLVETGDAWEVLVTATGSNGAVSTATADVVVGNHLPTATVSILPGMATTQSDLTAHAVANDADGHEVTLAYEWFQDGALVPEWSGPGVPASATEKGEAWMVRVTPSDGHDTGVPVESSVTIENTPAAVQSATASPSPVVRGDPVTLTLHAEDADGDSVTVTWMLPDDSTLNGASVETSFPEPGTYTITYEATDGTDTATGTVSVAVEEATVEIQDIAFDPDPVSFDQDLQAVVDVDAPDGYTLTFTWTKNGVDAGITTNTIPADQLRGMDTWSVTATLEQGGDSDTQEASITLPNRAPIATVTLPDSAQTSDDVTALVTGSDPDGHAVTYAYAWLRDGILQDHAAATLPAALTSRDEAWTVQVTPSDGYDEGMPVEATVVIENTPPVIEGIAVPATVHPGEVATLALAASDADGDPLTVTWMLPSGPATGTSVEEAFPEAGTYEVPVTVSDGTDEATTTVQLVVTDVPVVIHDVSLPDPVSFDEDLVATVSASGPDDMTITYEWHRNGEPTDVTGPSVPVDLLNGLDEWSITVTASHGDDIQSETAVTVVPNRVPVIEELGILPEEPVGGQALSVDVEAVDPDGHDVSLEVQWYRNGDAYSTEDVVPATAVFKGDQWRAVVTPSDGTDTGLPVEATITIANSMPVVASAGASPNPVVAGSAVELTVDAGDGDGDELSITWTLPNDQELSGASASTVFAAPGEYLVGYTVSDGEDAVAGNVVVTVTQQVSSGGGGSGGGGSWHGWGGQGGSGAGSGGAGDSMIQEDSDATTDGLAADTAADQDSGSGVSLDHLEADDDDVVDRGVTAPVEEVTKEEEAAPPGDASPREATDLHGGGGLHDVQPGTQWWMLALAVAAGLVSLLVSALLLAMGLRDRRARQQPP